MTDDEAPDIWLDLDGLRVRPVPLEEMTLGEQATLMDVSGIDDLGELFMRAQRLHPKVWTGIALVTLQRENPAITMEQVRSIVLLEQFVDDAGSAEESPPENGSTEPSPSQTGPPDGSPGPMTRATDGGGDPKTSGLRALEPSST